MQSMRKVLRACLAVVAGWSWLCAGPAAAQERVVIVGSGSNVPARLYQAWIGEFNKNNGHIQVQYLPLGTSESIHQISEGSGDFGGGEVPLTGQQMHNSKASLIQIPTVLVGIVPIYNLPGNPELNFSGELLGQIYLGTVKNWKDSRIAKLNPDVDLPDLAISVVHRTAGKGSNYIFTDFLSKTNPQFRSEVGKSPSPQWPLGTDANRGEDMVERVASTRGAIGYVESNLARNTGVGYGSVQNPSGHFAKATPESIAAACAAADKASGNLQMSLTNAPGRDSYPMSSFTWIYVPTSGEVPARRAALKQFLKWGLQEGQDVARNLGYEPLPNRVMAKAQAEVDSLK
jgi:phosphate transport system substrate-binding protein